MILMMIVDAIQMTYPMVEVLVTQVVVVLLLLVQMFIIVMDRLVVVPVEVELIIS